MEQGDILVLARKLSDLSFFLGIPLSPLESLTFHVADEVIEGLDVLKTFNCRPDCFRQELKRLSLIGDINGDLFLNKSHHFSLINLLLSNKDSQAEHGGYEQLVSFKKTSSGVVESLECD